MLEVGSRLPEVTFSHIDGSEMKHPHTNDLFADKKVAFFAVPGAFTPTDSGVCVSKVDCILDVASFSVKSFPTTLICNADDGARPDVKEMGENASVLLVVTAYKHSVKALASRTIFGD